MTNIETYINFETFKEYLQDSSNREGFSISLGEQVSKYLLSLKNEHQLSLFKNGLFDTSNYFSSALMRLIEEDDFKPNLDEEKALSCFFEIPLNTYINTSKFRMKSKYTEFVNMFNKNDVLSELSQLDLLRQCDCRIDIYYKGACFLAPREEKKKTKMISYIEAGKSNFSLLNDKKMLFM